MVSRYMILFVLATPAFAQSSDWMNAKADISLDPDQVAAGEALYAEHCAACHGADLEGAENWRGYNEDGTLKPPPHDASGHT